MPNDDQLSSEDLTALMLVRAQLPADDPRGAKIDAFIKSQLQNFVPDATTQAQAFTRSQIKPLIPGTGTIDPTGGGLAAAQAGQNSAFNEQMRQSGNLVGTLAGTAATGGLLPAVKGAGLATNALRLGGRALATGAGAGIGSLAGGATPQEASVNAAAGIVGQPIAEGITAGIGAGANALLGKAPSATATKVTAGQTIQNIKTIAGKVPVNTAKFGDSLLELFTQHGFGASFPAPAKKLLLRLTAKDAVPLTLEEAKGFQGQLTDFLKNPVDTFGARIKDANVFRIVGELNEGLKASIEDASQLGGFEPGTFTGAMQQFHKAATQEAMMQRLHDLAINGVKIAAGTAIGGAAARLGYDIYGILHPSKSEK